MATKEELLQDLEDAGEEGYSMADSKGKLEAAVASLVPAVNRQKGV